MAGPGNTPYYNQQPQPNWNGGQNSYIGNYQNQYQAGQIGLNPQFNPMGQDTNNTIQRSVLAGRVINSIDEVRPQEVPMDGSWTFFPVSNGQDIYAMTWNQEGQISKLHYIRDSSPVSQVNNSSLDQIMNRLDELGRQIDDLKHQYRYSPKKPRQSNHPKVEKEVTENA